MIRLLRYLRISNTMFEVKVISSSLNFIFISPSYFLTTLLMLFSPVPCIASDFFDDAMRLFLTATIFLTEFVSCIDRYLFLRTKAEKSINPFFVFCAASTAFSRRLSSRAVMYAYVIRLGTYHVTWSTGLHVKEIPFIDKISKKSFIKTSDQLPSTHGVNKTIPSCKSKKVKYRLELEIINNNYLFNIFNIRTIRGALFYA